MSVRKFGKWMNDNIVLLVGIPLIVGIHYAWSKLQEVPYLVDQSEKKDLPIIAAFKTYKRKGLEKWNDLTSSSDVTQPQEGK